jgi:LCP family protein required for cell wall assembly
VTPTRRARRRSPAPVALLLALLVGVVGSIGVLRAAEEATANVSRVKGLENVLADSSANDLPAENFLLVGSDSREGTDPDDAALGDVAGQRSDTIMLLRREKNGGAALMSFPRDLWVDIPGKGEGKINGAYNGGPQLLAQTITESFGIPVHHYVEVDFAGFRDIVDAIGGVEVCVEHLAQDANTGMRLEPGCHTVNGEGGLAYARSRYYEEFIDGSWRVDPRADLGRIERQQSFIRSAAEALLQEVIANPERLGDLVQVATRAITFDSRTNVLASGQALAAAAQDGMRSYTLPTNREMIGDQDAQRVIESEAEPILAYFRGDGPVPPSSDAPESTEAD